MTPLLYPADLHILNTLIEESPHAVRQEWSGKMQELYWRRGDQPFSRFLQAFWDRYRGDPDVLLLPGAWADPLSAMLGVQPGRYSEEQARGASIINPITGIINPITGTSIELQYLDSLAPGTSFALSTRPLPWLGGAPHLAAILPFFPCGKLDTLPSSFACRPTLPPVENA